MAFENRKNRQYTKRMLAHKIDADKAEKENMNKDKIEVCLATSKEEVEAAQRLRYKIFYDEMKAKASDDIRNLERDFDQYDDFCDHLIVVDRSKNNVYDSIVGTYRLLKRSVASSRGCGFYSSAEFNLEKLDSIDGEILEVGRSCVHQDYRDRATLQLLWKGIASYVFSNDIKLLFGCASFPTVDINELKAELTYLYHFHLAPPALRTKALDDRFVNMNLMSIDDLHPARTLASLPPLLKGYFRAGGFVGDGAVIDQEFNTTDVCILLKTDMITKKYFNHYARTANIEGSSE